MVIAVTGYAYPWDVLGDPGFADRVRAHGLTDVCLAASYHSARAATPLHPRHQLIDAHHAALYRPASDDVWAGRRLRPRSPGWMGEADPFADAFEALRQSGLTVHAWIVLTHNTGLGQAFPDVAVVNCFGDRYPYALCPAHEEVREYAAGLVQSAVRDVPVAGLSVEACGQLGLDHNSHHEKTAGAWTANANKVLSVCCCAACRNGWTARNLDPAGVIEALQHSVRTDEPLPDDLAGALLATRQESTDLLRTGVVEMADRYAPNVPITLHGHPDPWVTGPSPGLTPAASNEVTAVLVQAWPTNPATAEVVTAAAETGLAVDAYVTVLPPAGEDEVIPHVKRLIDAGATRLSLYHLGLAPAWRQPLFREVVDLVAGLGQYPAGRAG